jgi:hypothetical protein
MDLQAEPEPRRQPGEICLTQLEIGVLAASAGAKAEAEDAMPAPAGCSR